MILKNLMMIMLLPAVVHIYAADQKELNRQLYNALLHEASLERVENLIEVQGADINGIQEYSLFRSPILNLAARSRIQDSSVMLYLIACGADVNEKDSDGYTPCHSAAASNRADFIEILVVKGADVNVKNDLGTTPLHSACLHGTLCAAKVLLKLGAKTQVKNRGGYTPLDVARDHHHKEIVKYLEEWESVPEIKQPEED